MSNGSALHVKLVRLKMHLVDKREKLGADCEFFLFGCIVSSVWICIIMFCSDKRESYAFM